MIAPDARECRRVPASFSINYFLVAGGQHVQMYFPELNASYNMAKIHEHCSDLKITSIANAEEQTFYFPLHTQNKRSSPTDHAEIKALLDSSEQINTVKLK